MLSVILRGPSTATSVVVLAGNRNVGGYFVCFCTPHKSTTVRKDLCMTWDQSLICSQAAEKCMIKSISLKEHPLRGRDDDRYHLYALHTTVWFVVHIVHGEKGLGIFIIC